MALIDGDQPGWKRIVSATGLLQSAQAATQPINDVVGQAANLNSRIFTAVTQVFSLKNGDISKADLLIKPFLTQPGGNSLALSEQRILIVTDYESNMARISQLIKLVDQPERAIDVRFIALRYVEASQISGQVSQLLASRLKQRGMVNGSGQASGSESIDVIARSRQIPCSSAPTVLASSAS